MKKSNAPIFVVFLIFTFLLATLAWSYRNSIFFALILAGIFYPLMMLLKEKFKISDAIASISICIVITLCIFLPFIYISYAVSSELIILSQFIKIENISQGSQIIKSFYLGEGIISANFRSSMSYLNIADSYPELETVIINFIKSIGVTSFNFFNTIIGNLLGNILTFLWDYIIMLIFIFALLKNGYYIKDFLNRIIPLPKKVIDTTFDKFNQMNFVILVCNGLGGIIQGSLAGIIFWIAGIETIFLWGVLMMLLAFIPLIGMSVIYIPTAIYLFINGELLSGVFLLIGCIATSFTIENIYKPKFIGKRVKINPILLLFGIIGGLSFFGPQGIFYGPIIVTMFLTFVQFVSEENIIKEKVK